MPLPDRTKAHVFGISRDLSVAGKQFQLKIIRPSGTILAVDLTPADLANIVHDAGVALKILYGP